jgi:hypothetical protein
MTTPEFRDFIFTIQKSSDVTEVITLIDLVLKSYPCVDVGVIGRFLVDLSAHRP